MYSIFIHISIGHLFNCFVLITCRLFISWEEGAALLLLLLLPPAPGEADNLSMTRMSITISARHLRISMIIEITIRHSMMSLFGDHRGRHWASGHQVIPSCQHLENESQQLNSLLHWCNVYILNFGRSILGWRRMINASLYCWHPRRYGIKHLNDWIRLLMYIFTIGWIQTKAVRNWLHGKLKPCGNMNRLLTTWQALSSVQNTT